VTDLLPVIIGRTLNYFTYSLIIDHQVSSFMYKYNANILPINFFNYFTKNSAFHVHNTRCAVNFYLSFTYSIFRLNSIRLAGPRIWNNLPHDLKVGTIFFVSFQSYEITIDEGL